MTLILSFSPKSQWWALSQADIDASSQLRYTTVFTNLMQLQLELL